MRGGSSGSPGRAALALWRGRAFGELAYEDVARGEAERLAGVPASRPMGFPRLEAGRLVALRFDVQPRTFAVAVEPHLRRGAALHQETNRQTVSLVE